MNQEQFNRQLCEFLGAATTPFHAVKEMSRQLLEAGYTALSFDSAWALEAGGRYFVTRNGSSIVAFNTGNDAAIPGGFRMVGAHTDSPCLMVKPVPEVVRKGYFQLGVQVYGGALFNPWFDRDLSLAGRVSYVSEDGTVRLALVDFRDPVATIPSLAIHLDRTANESRSVNPQTQMVPLLALHAGKETPDFRSLLRARILQEHPQLTVGEVLDYELCLYDSQPPAVIGLNRDFIAGARLDNLLSCHVGLQSLLASDGEQAALLVANDHEEVGSLSSAGAAGPLLSDVLTRIAGAESDRAALVERSMMISTDNAHGVHPNYADRHDDNHGPLLNGGPVIKINASQRYATNSETSGLFRTLCAAVDVPVQAFVVRSDMGCGSTIGPITAGGVGVRTLDIGVPTFAMHSIRELAGSEDAWNLSRVLRHFYDFSGAFSAG